jgi:hypothetical protein
MLRIDDVIKAVNAGLLRLAPDAEDAYQDLALLREELARRPAPAAVPTDVGIGEALLKAVRDVHALPDLEALAGPPAADLDRHQRLHDGLAYAVQRARQVAEFKAMRDADVLYLEQLKAPWEASLAQVRALTGVPTNADAAVASNREADYRRLLELVETHKAVTDLHFKLIGDRLGPRQAKCFVDTPEAPQGKATLEGSVDPAGPSDEPARLVWLAGGHGWLPTALQCNLAWAAWYKSKTQFTMDDRPVATVKVRS